MLSCEDKILPFILVSLTVMHLEVIFHIKEVKLDWKYLNYPESNVYENLQLQNFVLISRILDFDCNSGKPLLKDFYQESVL